MPPAIDLLAVLNSYVPGRIRHFLLQNPQALTEPLRETYPGAALIADISGFTRLTEKLAEQGPGGAERITAMLNDYFGQLIDLINAHGGDVVSFAGDALLAIWPDNNITFALINAAQCALNLQARLRNYHTVDDTRLYTRIGIGAGQMVGAHIGGVFGRWEYTAAGDPLTQAAFAQSVAHPGEVVVHRQSWPLLRPHATALEMPSAHWQIEQVHARLTPTPAAPVQIPPQAESALRGYIPGAIIHRLVAGQTEWLSELRRVTLLFVNFLDLDPELPLETVQAAMHTVQSAIYRYEGSVNKITYDDKGVVVVGVLGLPPFAHEDDAARSLLTALDIQRQLAAQGMRSAIGVTSGRAFCGVVGNATRREYTMIGDVVNLASRLMQQASGHILTDQVTYDTARDRIEFEILPPVNVKGRTDPVAVFQPTREKRRILRTSPQVDIVNRERERRVISNALQQVLRNTSSIVILEGPAGIGKTRLIDEARRQAEALRIGIYFGAGDAVERQAAYHAFRGVFSQMFDLAILDEPEAQRQHMLNLIEVDDDLTEMATLLNPVLPFNLPETDATRQMTNQARADNTRELMLSLLQKSAQRNPKALIIENAHWLDSASWSLLLGLTRRANPLAVLISLRPFIEPPIPDEYIQLLTEPHSQHLVLEPLRRAEILNVVSRRLGVSRLPESIADMIVEHGAGNPLYSVEMALALRDSGSLVVGDDGYSYLAEGIIFDESALPDSIQGIVTTRIDQLPPGERLAIKVASVIGRTFSLRVLAAIYPLPADKPYLSGYLDKLEQMDIARRNPFEIEPTYTFTQIITQEVAYNLLPYEQRRRLHRAIAEWYERTFGDPLQFDESVDAPTHAYGDTATSRPRAGSALSPYYPLLVHHFSLAEMPYRERHYAQLAGELAAAQFALHEAERYFTRALRLTERADQIERFDIMLARERIYDILGERDKQQSDLSNLKLLSEQLPDLWRRAEANLRWANYATVTGKYIYAAALAQESIGQSTRPEDISRLAASHMYLGRAQAQSGDYPTAEASFHTALDLSRRAGLFAIEAGSLRSLGEIDLRLGRYDDGQVHLQQAIDLYRALGDRRGENITRSQLAALLLLHANYDEAGAMLSQLLDFYRDIGDRQGESATLTSLGVIARQRGQYDDAFVHFQQALDIIRAIGEPRAEAGVLINLGISHRVAGNYGQATHLLSEAMRIRERIGDIAGQAASLVELSHLHNLLNSFDRARDFAQQAIEICDNLHDRRIGSAAHHQLGYALLGLNDPISAVPTFEKAITFCNQLNQPYLAAESRAGLAAAYFRQGEVAEAAAQIRNVVYQLRGNDINSVESPFQVLFTAYQILSAADDATATDLLTRTYNLLQQHAGNLSNAAQRRGFLQIATHRAILDAFAA